MYIEIPKANILSKSWKIDDDRLIIGKNKEIFLKDIKSISLGNTSQGYGTVEFKCDGVFSSYLIYDLKDVNKVREAIRYVKEFKQSSGVQNAKKTEAQLKKAREEYNAAAKRQTLISVIAGVFGIAALAVLIYFGFLGYGLAVIVFAAGIIVSGLQLIKRKKLGMENAEPNQYGSAKKLKLIGNLLLLGSMLLLIATFVGFI